MNSNYTESEIKKFLDEHYTDVTNSSKAIDGVYFAHQPIYGYRIPYSETNHIGRYMITKSILDNLAKYQFTELIDISGAEGYTSHLIKVLFKANVRVTEWSESVCKLTRSIFGLNSMVADIKELPFKENEFEVVLCSETLEHVIGWEKGFEELLRITNKLLIVTIPHDSLEFVEYNRKHVVAGHINHFHDKSFDFLKERGYSYYIEKSCCPMLIKPRIIVEAYKKVGNSLGYKLYNMVTPFFKVLFGKKSACWLVNNDKKICQKMAQYGGLTLVVEKQPVERNKNYKPIKAEDFIDIVVPPYMLD